jgi:polysaccharide deacetylase family protein (PEP-CTERM system associated)
MSKKTTTNLLSVDLEEWFVVDILKDRYDYNDWDSLQSNVVKNARRLLGLFRKHNAKATWFSLGWVARHYPDLLQEIVNEGHEVACHSFYHRRVDQLKPDTFREDTLRAVDAIFMAIGNKPIGYRAPSWSMNAKTPWAFEILAQIGFEYDSSIFPIKHDIYGMPSGPRQLFKMTFENNLSMWELPASTFRFFGRNIPLAGGGFFRHSPYWWSRKLINYINRKGQPAVVYIHPWEFDPDPPRIEGLSPLQRFRTYGSTSILLYKFDRLLSDFNFITIAEYITSQKKRQIGFR